MECLRNVPTAIVQRATNTVSESLKLPMDFAFVPIGFIYINFFILLY